MALGSLIDRHRDLLGRAEAAIGERTFFSAYPESPSPRVYGETAAAEGQAAHEAHLGADFPLRTPGADGTVATETSPFGPELGVRYPRVPATDDAVSTLLGAAQAAIPAWRDAGADGRAAVCLEVLSRLHGRIFELAQAVMHTSGQAFVMAFQAGGAHALDRALEAVAYAHAEQARIPGEVLWEKPAKGEPLRMTKTFHVVPRGVALVIGCNTFPTWNSWPGLFASLATGNAVVVKPHPSAVLPLAITVRTIREVLEEYGFDPDLVTLAAEDPADRLAAVLAVRPEVRVIDFTGSTAFGEWLEQHARQAVVFTEKAGLNTVVVDSTDDLQGLVNNLAFSLSLYTGQMCTAPQNVFVPRDGVLTDQGRVTFDGFGQALAGAIDKLLGDDARAVEILGAVVNDGVRDRVDATAGDTDVVLAARTIQHPAWPEATVRTPAVVAVDIADQDRYSAECFGPVSFLIAADSTAQALDRFASSVREHGGMTASVYSTDPAVLDAAEQAAVEAAVPLSINLTGGVFVNQSAAFSDFHGTGANPAANATLTDAAFVASRFRVVAARRHA
ncbi:phenylacetic acid degradation protein PaaN [Jiangella sp. DSM 45060]|uniref:phenylacetic acid degradation protein PaaN n=1 Tax=Jiangella sp. DSM 45060 TaxID=1798224 RepID=UPI00087C99D7|nr:phenylacetic acid degradation protein PaaN [Jiangella sp. DSM 45060]SDT67362.1 phenylacetic acid degradation protein paaN [Jiangella sp. DSM 45060]